MAHPNHSGNGLILIDFRKIPPPPFVTKWPVVKDSKIDNWNFSHIDGKKKYSRFSWSVEGDYIYAGIDAYVFENYESASEYFSSGTMTSLFPSPWVICEKRIGTSCLRSSDKRTVFFYYKNIYIKVVGAAEEMAEWLFNVLKAHPLTPMLPPGPLTLAKPGYPVPKQGYWKTFIPPELAPKEAPRLNANGPLYKYQGDKLNALGFEGPPVWDNLVWIWIGENYPDQQAVFQAGGIAVERYDRERRNPPE